MASRASRIHNLLFLLLRIGGFIPWRKGGFAGILSTIYIFYTRWPYVWGMVINLLPFLYIWDVGKSVKYFCRFSFVFLALIQLLLVSHHSPKILTYAQERVHVHNSKQFKRTVKNNTLFYVIFYLCCVPLWMTNTAIKMLKPFFSSISADQDQDLDNYTLELIHGNNSKFMVLHKTVIMIAMMLSAMSFIVHDLVLIYLLTVARCALRRVHSRISSNTFNAALALNTTKKRQTTLHIKYCVQLHQHAISAMRLANEVFSTSLLMVVVRTFVMCVSAYELSKTKHVAHMAEVIGIFWLAMIQLFTLGWIADNVTNKGKALSLLCVQQAWCCALEHQTSTRRISSISSGHRSLLVMAARCRIPLEMHAGPFYKLSVNMFKKILGAAFSYFTFFFTLTQHRDNKN